MHLIIYVIACSVATGYARRMQTSLDASDARDLGILADDLPKALKPLFLALNSVGGVPSRRNLAQVHAGVPSRRNLAQVQPRSLQVQANDDNPEALSFGIEFSRFVQARYPLLFIPTAEEERLERAISLIAKRTDNQGVYVWDFVQGFQGNPNSEGTGKRDPVAALEFIEKLPKQVSGIFILRDFQRFFNDVSVSRKLRNLARSLKVEKKTVVIVAPEVNIPTELAEIITVVDFPLPTAPEIQQELERLLTQLDQDADPTLVTEFTRAALGLSLDRIKRVLARCIVKNGAVRPEDLSLILEEKRQSIRQTQVLDFYPASESISDIGGLDNLKDWLLRRGNAFGKEAREYGLPYPKGLLLVGIQGTGKSLSAKAIAQSWRLPLLRLDVGRLFAGLVGESEERTRQAIRLAEALAPCVFWIDEIDKAFAGSAGLGDSGTTGRVFSTFITWMAEKKTPVFIVATANNIAALPPEILRKGRFDEIFFVGLPNESERKEIFNVHLTRFRPESTGSFDTDLLAKMTSDFSGAEIEQTVVEAMYTAFGDKREFSTEDVLAAATEVVPLAKTAKEQIGELQNWAKSGRARLASKS